MTRQNMHIHSKYSWDCEKYGRMEIEEIARILSENGIRYGAITDHVEFDKEPLPLVLTKLRIRNLEINKVNEQYEGKVTLLKAVEVSEPHLYKANVEALSELELDFIMGSIHQMNRNAKTKEEIIHENHLYYAQLMKMVEANQIDVIGHLDYIRRVYPEEYNCYNQVFEVLHAIKERDLVIEINSSAQRRNGLGLFPSPSKIIAYQTVGGSNVTIGTDAHCTDELMDNLSQTENLVKKLKLQPVIYQKRKRINL